MTRRHVRPCAASLGVVRPTTAIRRPVATVAAKPSVDGHMNPIRDR
jgi:hypothetical protein